MTDRSSQSCSADGNQTSTQLKDGRVLTITVSRNNARTSPPAEDSNSSANNSNKSSSNTVDNKTSDTVEKKKPSVKTKDQEKEIQTKEVQANKQRPVPYQDIDYPSHYQPAVVHANFDPNREVIDPARPLTDIPEPAPRHIERLTHIFADHVIEDTPVQKQQTHKQQARDNQQELEQSFLNSEPRLVSLSEKQIQAQKQEVERRRQQAQQKNASKWDLIQSPDLAEHLALLQAGGLAKIPASFYHNTSTQPLLTSIDSMRLVDMADIKKSVEQLSINEKGQTRRLTRHGFVDINDTDHQKVSTTQQANAQYINTQHTNIDEICNSQHAPTWEVILYPHRYDQGFGNLSTDIMATSVVKHALSQCSTRKTINHKLSAEQIVQYLRSYLLSQCTLLPHKSEQLKQIHIYVGHVIVVADLLGWKMESTANGQMVFNVSSRCGLFSRYPVLSDYYVKGWT